eukprot:GHVU01064336.1.p1 GENE.GHVU01064336.1~~GHVU01064336.1.p1  ORF type:complete len:153 (+),score=0.98 GHVU01064336.1:84-542(+)
MALHLVYHVAALEDASRPERVSRQTHAPTYPCTDGRTQANLIDSDPVRGICAATGPNRCLSRTLTWNTVADGQRCPGDLLQYARSSSRRDAPRRHRIETSMVGGASEGRPTRAYRHVDFVSGDGKDGVAVEDCETRAHSPRDACRRLLADSH